MRPTKSAVQLDCHRFIQKTYAGIITMVGTAPTFYKIPVTTDDFLISLATAQYPLQATTIEKLIPPVPSPARLANDGMKPLDNRGIIFLF